MKNFIFRSILSFIILYFSISGQNCLAQMQIPDSMKDQIAMLHNTCRDETQTKEEIIQQSIKGNLENDRNLACYINCMFGKLGMLNENNELQVQHILDMLPSDQREMFEKMVKTCGVIRGNDACETAWMILKCFLDADHEHSMLM